MDYDVPSVDKLIAEALASVDGEYAAGQLLVAEWERWEVLDDRAIDQLNDAIKTLQEVKDAIAKVLDGKGQYDFSDHDR